jgi:protein-S-isoprenylcysteine O-methyltransferase Ste14
MYGIGFKIILIVIYSLFSIIRIQYQVRAQRSGYRTVIEESRKYSVFLSLLICYEVFTLFIYLLFPGTLAWAALALPEWVQWTGVFLGIAALGLFIWVHRNLGMNFARNLRIADRQVLIETGPYNFVRHPMYTAFYLLHCAAFLITMNWFIGLTWLTGLTIIIALRVKREEEMMISRFGNQYLLYMNRTGRFIPQIKLRKPDTD